MDEIEVVYNDGMYGFVDPDELDRLISAGEIIKFLRGSEWVFIGIDPVRSGKSQPVSWEKRRSNYT